MPQTATRNTRLEARISRDGLALVRRAAEIEGRSKAALFSGILDDWKEDGVSFVTLSGLAREALAARRDRIPAREISRVRLPGRGGEVSTGWPEAEIRRA